MLTDAEQAAANAAGRMEMLPEHFDNDLSAPCGTCIHKWQAGAFCDAFPQGIPDPIREGTHRHTTPYPGDGGVLYARGFPPWQAGATPLPERPATG